MPEFSDSQMALLDLDIIPEKFSENLPYDIVIGREGLKKLKMVMDYDKSVIKWGEIEIAMKSDDFYDSKEKLYAAFVDSTEPEEVIEENDRTNKILDATYEKADLTKLVYDNCNHLNTEEKNLLYKTLIDFEDLFDGTLGTWNCDPVAVDVKPDATPYHAKPYGIPQVHIETVKKEVARLVKLGVLERDYESAWASPCFIRPKKNGTVRFLTDLRQLNKRIIRKPFPLPKITDVMQRLEGFQYATALDLNMGYYHIKLNPDAQRLCTIVLPWGKYKYKRLPMGLSVSADIFQAQMSQLTGDLDYARAYLDDLLCMTSGSFEDHINKLKILMTRLRAAGLKVNAEKSLVCQHQIEYLGYLMSRDGIKPVNSKIKTILALQPPKNLKELRSVLGMVQFYRDMWEKRTHILSPLTDLVGECGDKTSNKKKKSRGKKFHWDDVHQKAFDEMKKIVSREISMAYPDFSKPFEIHTDASARQLGAVITQNNRPIAFYSKKLNTAQQNYTVTDLELLSVVMTLKEFRNILLGQVINIYTDHKNLESDFSNMTSQRSTRWRMIVEEYGPIIKYIKGTDNTVADALSRLNFSNNPNKTKIQENFCTLARVMTKTHSNE